MIHEGPARRSNVDWLVHCVEEAVQRHLEYHPDIQEVDAILDRYNLPDVAPLVEHSIPDDTSV